jgi:hypothetical protein
VSQAFPPLGQEYEPFLYAVVCNEGNGMPLTVVSALARSGADPWKEAARIAKLPKTAALDVLAHIIPERASGENVAIANRLLALLPAARESVSFRAAVSVTKDVPPLNPALIGLVALLVCLAVAYGYRKIENNNAGPNAPSSTPPMADKADP